MPRNPTAPTLNKEDDSLCLVEDLVALRKRKGLSQQALAERLGVSQQRMSQLETQQSCNLDTLVRWAQQLDRRLELTYR